MTKIREVPKTLEKKKDFRNKTQRHRGKKCKL